MGDGMDCLPGMRAVEASMPGKSTLTADAAEEAALRALCHIPAGRGCGATPDVRRHPVVDRPTARTARAHMSGRVVVRQAAMEEVCAGVPKLALYSALVPLIGDLERALLASIANCRCSRRLKT